MLVAFSGERVMPAKVGSPDAAGDDMVVRGIAYGDELFSGLCHGRALFLALHAVRTGSVIESGAFWQAQNFL